MLKVIQHYHREIPSDEMTICVDEKTGIQVLDSLNPDKINSNGTIVYRDPDYIRKGVLCLLAGYEITNGKVIGIVREKHKTEDFIKLLEELLKRYKTYKRVNIVLDNFSTHKSKDLKNWLEKNPNNFNFVFLPFHGSWLNQIEIWFGIFSRECLKNNRSVNKKDMFILINEYIKTYNDIFAHPFKWQYGNELLKK